MKPRRYLFSIIILLSLSLATLFLNVVFNYGKTGDNTFLLGKDYSHLTRDQIMTNLSKDFSLPSSLSLITADKTFSFPLNSASASIDREATAKHLLSRRLSIGLINYFKYFYASKNFQLDITFNYDQFNESIKSITNQIDKPAIPSQLEIKKGQIVVTKGQIGQTVDVKSLATTIISQLSSANFSSIALPIVSVGQASTPNEEATALSRANKLLTKNLVLLVDGFPTVDITRDQIISWISFSGGFDTSKIREYLATAADSLKKTPVDASFRFEGNRVTEFRPSSDGIDLNVDQTVTRIVESLIKLESDSGSKTAVDVVVDRTPPKIKTGDVNDLGIKELLGRGVSTFKHSSAIRNFNVEKGASIVNRILVAPGDTFSFIKNLGEVTLESGYKKAYIIRQGKTELDVGGGICQVSTTLFRAMLNAGLNIIERHPHAYRVSYYEEDSPPGYDATVFIPSPDLKFINDTGHYVLVQNTFDGTAKKLTYEIYGTSDGRVTTISNYRQWGSQPPPPDKYIDDPTLPVGKVVQDEHRIPGLKTSFDWKVVKDGQTLHEQTFTSSYVPWAAVYRRGTKTN